MIEFARIVRTRLGERVRVLLADLRGVGQDTDDANAEPADGVEMLFPHGFVSRPRITRTLEAVVARLGDELVALFAHDKGTAAFTVQVEEDEVRIYNAAGAMVRLRASGNIIVQPADGHDVYLGSQAGTEPVALGIQLTNHLAAIQAWMDGHTHPVTGTANLTSGAVTGATTPPVGSSPVPPDVAADHVFVKTG